MTHEELQSLLGAYALDAVDPDEATAIERHLAECPRCRVEVAAHRDTASLLGNAGGDAPDWLWDRIAGGLHTVEAGAEAPRPLPAGVVPLPSRRQVALPVLAGVAAAAAVVFGLLGVSTVRLQHRVDSLHAAVAAGGLQQAAAAAVLNPKHVVTRLASADGRLTAQVVSTPSGDAYLVSANLPALDTERTYQLWGLSGSRVVSLGLLGPNPQVVAFRIDPAVSRLMVTAEPKGGVPAPDSAVLMQGSVPV